jgi:hypothetical protein
MFLTLRREARQNGKLLPRKRPGTMCRSDEAGVYVILEFKRVGRFDYMNIFIPDPPDDQQAAADRQAAAAYRRLIAGPAAIKD